MENGVEGENGLNRKWHNYCVVDADEEEREVFVPSAQQKKFTYKSKKKLVFTSTKTKDYYYAKSWMDWNCKTSILAEARARVANRCWARAIRKRATASIRALWSVAFFSWDSFVSFSVSSTNLDFHHRGHHGLSFRITRIWKWSDKFLKCFRIILCST